MAIQPPTTSISCCTGQQTFTSLQKLWSSKLTPQPTPPPIKLPRTSSTRLTSTSNETILYLAYGSNLSAETFKGARGIKPLSSLNVHAPSLDLTFSLPGIPYIEPCFANTRCHIPPTSHSPKSSKTDYHKDRWTKGLIGVVYEVTPEDYRTIIATEGGGANYHDVIVPCYALPAGAKTVDPVPTGASFKAHTLLRPEPEEEDNVTDGIVRPVPSYAQASARYLKLITSGGEEHELPEEYMAYLYSIRPYTITTVRQRAGQAIIITMWMPILLFLFGLGKVFADDEGKIPGWLASVMGVFMKVLWGYYDMVLKKTCGDGERTIGEDEDGDEESGGKRWCEERVGSKWCEKSVRLE